MPAGKAWLFWDAGLDGGVFPVEAAPCASQTDGFDLLALRWRAALLRSGGREELAIDAPGGAVRLSLESGTLLNGPVRLRYLLDGHRLSNRLAALQRWDRLCRTGTASPTSAATPTKAARWPLLVATLDAIAGGSTLRQTAIRLFGKETVERDWHHESDYLKLRTRRLVTQARALAAGGYRALL